MKCPICSGELTPSKKDSSYLLCFECKKKFKVSIPETTNDKNDDNDDVEFHFRYANIPPKEIREKQEREMRAAYDELLSIGKEERKEKKRGFFGRRK